MKKKLMALTLAALLGTMAVSACDDMFGDPGATNPPIEDTGPGGNPATDPNPNDGIEGPIDGGIVD